jgi:hypothetical protein
MAFDRDQIRKRAAELAAKGVYLDTSSWKYEGWYGQLYTPARYEYRGKVAKTRFERDCLSEYAEVFKTVCVDAAYYTFPSLKYRLGSVPWAASEGLAVWDRDAQQRFLLKPGRKYEDAVKQFQPYDKVIEAYPGARAAAWALIVEGVTVRQHRRTFIYINNRLEGNAIAMIQAMAARLPELLPN